MFNFFKQSVLIKSLKEKIEDLEGMRQGDERVISELYLSNGNKTEVIKAQSAKIAAYEADLIAQQIIILKLNTEVDHWFKIANEAACND